MAITPRQLADLARAALYLARAQRSLRHLSSIDLAGMRAPAGFSASPTGRQADRIARIAWAIPRAAARMPGRSDCLVQALAARGWAAKHRIDAHLVIGVRKEGDALDAHAWLTAFDQTIVGDRDADYAELSPGP